MNALSDLAIAALDLTEAWCSIPSVRGDDAAITRQVRAIGGWLRQETGADIISERSLDGRPPVIHARLDIGAADTVILYNVYDVLYNVYDVMPADGAGWAVDPFRGGVVDLGGVGPSFVARGAGNNKGPLAGMLCVLKDLLGQRAAEKVNVEILVEGEEESGSGALRACLLDADCPVRPSRGDLFPSFCEYGGGPPRLYLGFSGIAKGVVEVKGGAWGGPSAGIHSSNAPWMANPASRLVEALAAFDPAPTGELQRVQPDAEARTLVSDLAAQFDPAAELRFRHARKFAAEGDAKALLSRVLSTVSANISGLATAPAGDAIIPAAARAGFDLRCPQPLDPFDYVETFRRKLAERGLDGITVDLRDSYPGHHIRRDSAGVEALLKAYAGTARPPQMCPWAIGSAPGYAFARHVGSCIIKGAGRDGNAHGINEFMTLDGLEGFLRPITRWLEAMGEGALSDRSEGT